MTSPISSTTESPPIAPQHPTAVTLNGETRVDPYAWLRNRDDPEVIAYLEAENRYTAEFMAPLRELEDELYREIVGRIKETDLGAPERIDGWWYYVRTEAGQQYPILCRRKVPAGVPFSAPMDTALPEEILLDQNQLAQGHDYFRIGVSRVSPDHRYLAYSTDTSGAEMYTLRVKDLTTGELLSEEIPGTSHGVEWAADNATLFYSTLNETHRPASLWRHRLGTDPAGDERVFHEPDESFFLDLSRTRDRRYLILSLGSHSTSEAWYLSTGTPEQPFRLFRARIPGVEYDITHRDGEFYILTNEDALNFQILKTPVTDTARERWTPVVPPSPDVKVDGIDLFQDFMVIYLRGNALQQIRVTEFATGAEHLVEFDEPVYTIRRMNNPEFSADQLRLTYSSLVTPPTVIDYDLRTRERIIRKETEVLGGYDRSHYRMARLFATAPDGVQVPISLVWREPLTRDGSRPLLLHGYGAYGLSYDPSFSTTSVSLLDRGWVVGIAHIRGGEEMGRRWYEDGKLLRKRNSFTDFIAVAEHLVAEGFTSADRLAISGGSAGGLLMGAVTNLRPDLFRAVVAEVPFVDVLNTMLDPTLPLTVIEYDEWGDPRDPVYYDYIRSYSPYDNVVPADYPAMLVTGGLNDPRVAFWEPAKWVARLRATGTGSAPLLLRTHMGAGHGGVSGRYDALREVAMQYGWLIGMDRRTVGQAD